MSVKGHNSKVRFDRILCLIQLTNLCPVGDFCIACITSLTCYHFLVADQGSDTSEKQEFDIGYQCSRTVL